MDMDENETLQEPEPVATDKTDEAQSGDVRVVDKRRFARLLGFGSGSAGRESVEAQEDAADTGRRLPTYVEELKQRADRAEAHARAEVEAARGRLERYYENQLTLARGEIVADLLDVLDNLERALDAPGAAESTLYEGVAATRDLFLKKLVELGVEAVPGVGAPFDPELHEAVEEVEVDNAELDGHVVDELKRGFWMGERLLRPAVVRVGRASNRASHASEL